MADDPFADFAASVIEVDPSVASAIDAKADLEPGSRQPCPDCGKVLTVTRLGALRSHKCVREIEGGPIRRGRRGNGGGRRTAAPKGVYTLAVACGEGVTEYSASRYVARAAECDLNVAKQITKLSNVDGGSDALFGPLINAIWPELPKGAQKTLEAIADHSDLIACAFAWADYMALLRQGIEVLREQNNKSEGVGTYGIQGQTVTGGFEPFVVADNG